MAQISQMERLSLRIQMSSELQPVGGWHFHPKAGSSSIGRSQLAKMQRQKASNSNQAGARPADPRRPWFKSRLICVIRVICGFTPEFPGSAELLAFQSEQVVEDEVGEVEAIAAFEDTEHRYAGFPELGTHPVKVLALQGAVREGIAGIGVESG